MRGNDVKNRFFDFGLIGWMFVLLIKIFLSIIKFLLGIRIEQRLKMWIGRLFKKEHEQSESEKHRGILELFETRWMMVENIKNNREEELFIRKKEFFFWMEKRYDEHLKKYEDNKKDYFKSAGRWKIFESLRMVFNMTVIKVCVFLGTVCLPLIFTQNFYDFANNFIKTEGNLEEFAKLMCVIMIIILWILLSYGIILFFTKHFKLGNSIEQKRETWLRHSEIVWRYQYEMINYMMDTSEYKEFPLMEDKDKIFMDRMIAVVERNIGLFQGNMRKRGDVLSDKE